MKDPVTPAQNEVAEIYQAGFTEYGLKNDEEQIAIDQEFLALTSQVFEVRRKLQHSEEILADRKALPTETSLEDETIKFSDLTLRLIAERTQLEAKMIEKLQAAGLKAIVPSTLVDENINTDSDEIEITFSDSGITAQNKSIERDISVMKGTIVEDDKAGVQERITDFEGVRVRKASGPHKFREMIQGMQYDPRLKVVTIRDEYGKVVSACFYSLEGTAGAYINFIGTFEGGEGKGGASALIQYLKERYSTLRLTVSPSNMDETKTVQQHEDKLRKWYQSLGFVGNRWNKNSININLAKDSIHLPTAFDSQEYISLGNTSLPVMGFFEKLLTKISDRNITLSDIVNGQANTRMSRLVQLWSEYNRGLQAEIEARISKSNEYNKRLLDFRRRN